MSDNVAKFLSAIIGEVKDAEKVDREIGGVTEEVYNTYIDSLNKQIADLKGQHGEVRATSNLQSMLAICSGLSKIVTQGNTALTSYQMTVHRAALEYAAASLRVTQAA